MFWKYRNIILIEHLNDFFANTLVFNNFINPIYKKVKNVA
jgi:hypothetical protein